MLNSLSQLTYNPLKIFNVFSFLYQQICLNLDSVWMINFFYIQAVDLVYPLISVGMQFRYVPWSRFLIYNLLLQQHISSHLSFWSMDKDLYWEHVGCSVIKLESTSRGDLIWIFLSYRAQFTTLQEKNFLCHTCFNMQLCTIFIIFFYK